MTESQRRQSRISAVAGVLATLLVALLDVDGWLRWLELRSLDWRFRHVASIPIRDEIVIIAIDDGAIRDVGRWPWHRDTQAGLIRVLHEAGARSILVDLNWEEPEPIRGELRPNFDMVADPEDFAHLGDEPVCPDLQLADAIRAAGNCYLALSLDDSPHSEAELSARVREWIAHTPDGWNTLPRVLAEEFLPRIADTPFERESSEKHRLLTALRHELSVHASLTDPLLPLERVRSIAARTAAIMPAYFLHARAARRCGFVTYKSDPDGIARRQWLFAALDDRLVTQIAFALVCDELEIDQERSTAEAGCMTLVRRDGGAPLRIPLDETGRMLVAWAFRPGNRIAFDAVSATGVVAIDQYRRLIEQNERLYRGERMAVLAESLANTGRSAGLEALLRERAMNRATALAARYAGLMEEARAFDARVSQIDHELERIEESLQTPPRGEQPNAGQPESGTDDSATTAAYQEAVRNTLAPLRAVIDRGNAELQAARDDALRALRPRVEGKICLIGYVATAQGDIVATPLSPQTPGVLAHAHLINGLLQSRIMNWSPAAVNHLLTILLGAAATVFGVFRRPWEALVLCLLTTGLYTAVALLAFRAADYWLPLAAPLAALFAVYAVQTIYQYFFVDAQRRRLSTALMQFTSPEIARQVADNPELCRKAETRDVTAMFTDLRGFTPISERIGAERTQRVLNVCLERFCQVLLHREAIINKFMGDGVFAFWNPLIFPQPNHARLACEAAIDLITALGELSEEQRTTGGDEVFSELFLRIGIATGRAVVGPCGSEQKFDYTCIGDCVNVASRLEGTNKAFGTRILVNDEARRSAGEGFLFRPLGGVLVKGKQIPVQVFELVCREADAAAGDREYAEAFGAALNCFSRRAFTEARTCFETCLAERPSDAAAEAYARECRRLEAEPPTEDWQPALDTA